MTSKPFVFGNLLVALGSLSTACSGAGADSPTGDPSNLGSTGGGGGSTFAAGGGGGLGSLPPPGNGSAGTAGASTLRPPGAGGGTVIPPGGAGGSTVISPGGAGGAGGGGSCLDGITDYENAGPFQFTTATSGMVKIWVPKVPSGCKVPVIHLANGTTATCANYQGALERFASHGFLTTCYESPNTGAGDQGITAFDAAFAMYPDLADNKLGSTGHSQGGQAAFTVLQLAEAKWGDKMIYAGLAMEPASGFGTQPTGGTWQQVYAKIKSPMFMFSGTADTLVAESWVQQAYDAMNKANEVYWWSAVGATHIPTPVGPEQQVSIPWFRWKLLGDKAACEFFKKMPDGPNWDPRKSENEKACQ